MDVSVDAVHESWIELDVGLVPVGRPGVVGGVVSAGPPDCTVIDADAVLFALAWPAGSIASTV